MYETILSSNFIESRQKKTFRALKIKYRINQMYANNLVIIAKCSNHTSLIKTLIKKLCNFRFGVIV